MLNTLEVWWIGFDGSVQDAYWYEGGGPWNQVTLAPKGSASIIGRITAVSRIPNSMEVWWTGNDGSLRDANFYQGGSWNQSPLSPSHTASYQGGIAAVSRIPSSMEVWWIGGNGSVQDSYWYDSTSFNVQAFSDRLQSDLQGKAVGYSFSVSYQDQWEDMRAGGSARTSADSNPLLMNPFVQFSIASLSKTITAAAALQLLEPNQSNNLLDAAVGQYLPADFTRDNNFKAITFRQLLQHRSGVPAKTGYDVDYNSLKSYVNGYPNVSNKSYQYSNTNYALFRLLIPNLAGIPLSGDPGTAYADAYIQYVQQHVFSPIVLGSISASTDSSSGLDYHFPLQPYHPGGWDLGDLTLKIASQGWVMSTQDLAHFLRDLSYTENILSGAISKQMRDKCMGYDACGAPAASGSTYAYWSKGGFYPGCGFGNPGEFNGSSIVFSNGLSVAVIVNSNLAYNSQADSCGYQDSDPVQAVLDAFNNAIGK
jgi:CubicO group peptidase (beta-lactamase class C family)